MGFVGIRVVDLLGEKPTARLRHDWDRAGRDQDLFLRGVRLTATQECAGTGGRLTRSSTPTRLHPGAPHSELFREPARPGVGLVDRLKDMITHRATR